MKVNKKFYDLILKKLYENCYEEKIRINKQMDIILDKRLCLDKIDEEFDVTVFDNILHRIADKNDSLYHDLEYLLKIARRDQLIIDGQLKCGVCGKNITEDCSDNIEQSRCDKCAYKRNHYL